MKKEMSKAVLKGIPNFRELFNSSPVLALGKVKEQYETSKLGLVLLNEFISVDQEKELLAELLESKDSDIMLRRWRKQEYIQGHWDKAITDYKETQRSLQNWSQHNRNLLKNTQDFTELVSNRLNFKLGGKWLDPHVIDLKEKTGEIFPHVDHIKHSAEVICGLSLLSDRKMLLSVVSQDQKNHNARAKEEEIEAEVEINARSFYILSGRSRFQLAHSILSEDQRRLSIILRDTF